MNETTSHEHTIDVLRELGEAANLSMHQRVALLILAGADGPMPMGYLALRLGMSRGAATSIADHLEDLRMVKREFDKDDRRKVRLKLMAPGVHVVEKATKHALEEAS